MPEMDLDTIREKLAMLDRRDHEAEQELQEALENRIAGEFQAAREKLDGIAAAREIYENKAAAILINL